MLDIYDFDSVFSFDPNHSYSAATVTQIQGNRKKLGGKLFVDRLFGVLGVEGGNNDDNEKNDHDERTNRKSGVGVNGSKSEKMVIAGAIAQSVKIDSEEQKQQQQQKQHHHHSSPVYPPHTNTDLRNLHSRIVSSPNADHHKQSLLFYLLKDCQTKPHDDYAHEFANGCYLLQKYWVCVEGFWEMDRRQFAAAMDFLAQPSLIPTFAEEILHALLLNVDNGNKDSTEDLHLPLSYYQSVSPGITSPEIRDAYFNYLARLSVTEAYSFARAQQPRNIRSHLLELLATSVLSSNNTSNGGDDRAARGLELVDLPFDDEEEEYLFATYLLRGKGKMLPGAKDTVMMRWVAKGDMQRALNLGDDDAGGRHHRPRFSAGRKHDGVNWDAVKEGIERGLGSRKDIGNLYSG